MKLNEIFDWFLFISGKLTPKVNAVISKLLYISIFLFNKIQLRTLGGSFKGRVLERTRQKRRPHSAKDSDPEVRQTIVSKTSHEKLDLTALSKCIYRLQTLL